MRSLWQCLHALTAAQLTCSLIVPCLYHFVADTSRRSGFIDKDELRHLIQSSDLGLQPATASWLVDSVVDTVLRSYDKVRASALRMAHFCALMSGLTD